MHQRREEVEGCDGEWEDLDRHVEEFGKLCCRYSIPCILAYVRHGPRDSGPLTALAGDNGLDFVDVSRAFEGRSVEVFAVFLTGGQRNAETHAMFADPLFPALTKRLPVR